MYFCFENKIMELFRIKTHKLSLMNKILLISSIIAYLGIIYLISL